MQSALGLTALGIEAGGAIAAMQQAAMTGGSVSMALMPAAAPLVAAGLVASLAAGAAGAAAARAIGESRVLPEAPNGINGGSDGARFVVVAHDYGRTLSWSKGTHQEARALLGQIKLRRFAVELGRPTKKEDGTPLPWSEFDHAGAAPHVDNDMRNALALHLANGVQPGRRWLVAAHNWGTPVLWSFHTEGEALAVLGALQLRRFGVDVHDGGWREFGHAGACFWVDNQLRSALASVLPA